LNLRNPALRGVFLFEASRSGDVFNRRITDENGSGPPCGARTPFKRKRLEGGFPSVDRPIRKSPHVRAFSGLNLYCTKHWSKEIL